MLKAVTKKEDKDTPIEELENNFVSKKAQEAKIEINNIIKEIYSHQDRLNKIDSAIKEKEGVLQSIKADLSQKKSDLESVKVIIKELRDEMFLTEELKKNAHNLLDEERILVGKELKDIYTNLEKQREIASSEEEKIKKELVSLQEELKASRREADIIFGNKAEAERDLLVVKNLAEEIEKYTEGLSISKETLELEVSALRATIEDIRKSNQEDIVVRESLSKEIDTLKEKITELSQEVEDKKYEKLSLLEWKEKLDDYANRIKEHYKKAGISINI
jgi:chromosome segregation ATPase